MGPDRCGEKVLFVESLGGPFAAGGWFCQYLSTRLRISQIRLLIGGTFLAFLLSTTKQVSAERS